MKGDEGTLFRHSYRELSDYSAKCKPCPKCQKKVSFLVDEYENGDTSHIIECRCNNARCGYERCLGTVSFYEPDDGAATLNEAVRKWNEDLSWCGEPVF